MKDPFLSQNIPVAPSRSPWRTSKNDMTHGLIWEVVFVCIPHFQIFQSLCITDTDIYLSFSYSHPFFLIFKCEALLRLAFSARARARQLYSNFKTVRSEQLNATITQNLLLAQLFFTKHERFKTSFYTIFVCALVNPMPYTPYFLRYRLENCFGDTLLHFKHFFIL